MPLTIGTTLHRWGSRSPLLAPPDHAVDRGQAERRTTGEQHGVEPLDRAHRFEQRQLAAGWGAPPGSPPTPPCRRAGAPPCTRACRVGPVPDPDPLDVGDHP